MHHKHSSAPASRARRSLASLSSCLAALALIGCAESGDAHLAPAAPHGEARAAIDQAVDVALLALDQVGDLASARSSAPAVAVAEAEVRQATERLAYAGQALREAGAELAPGRDAVVGELAIRVGQLTPRLRKLARAVRAGGFDAASERQLLSAIAQARVAVRSLDLSVGELHGEVHASSHADLLRGRDRNGPLWPGSPWYVLDEGHIDAVDVAYEADEFELSIHDESVDPDVERDPATTILVVKAAAKLQVPDARFAFLGPVGANVWILPEAQTDAEAAGILWPGLATEEVEAGVFVDDSVRVRWRNVIGPNGVSLFFSPPDEVTAPVVVVDSEDGLPDRLDLPVGTHTHLNWAFESPGIYLVKYDVGGRLAGVPGEPWARSSVVTLTFVVLP